MNVYSSKILIDLEKEENLFLRFNLEESFYVPKRSFSRNGISIFKKEDCLCEDSEFETITRTFRVLKGTLTQILKSANIFVFS